MSLAGITGESKLAAWEATKPTDPGVDYSNFNAWMAQLPAVVDPALTALRIADQQLSAIDIPNPAISEGLASLAQAGEQLVNDLSRLEIIRLHSPSDLGYVSSLVDMGKAAYAAWQQQNATVAQQVAGSSS